MSFMMEKIAWLLNKFSGKIPAVDIPWDNLSKYQTVLDEYLSQANILFPVDTLLTILIIYGVFRAALLVIWTISFVRSLLPF